MLQRYFRIGMNTGYSVTPVIHVNQYDHDEQWIFTLVDETGAVYTPSTGGIVGLKSDGNVIVNAGTVNSSGQVVINETQQMTAAAGDAIYELLLDNSTHGSANFIVRVEPKPGDNASMSASDLSLLQKAIDSTNPEHIADSVQDWMNDNLAPSQWVIDNTLSIAGAAADAKKVGDVTSELKTIFKKDISHFIVDTVKTHSSENIFQGYGYISSTNKYVFAENSNYGTCYTDLTNVYPGAEIITKASLAANTGAIIYDANLNVLDYITSNNAVSKGYEVSAVPVDVSLTVPQGAVWLAASIRNIYYSDVSAFDVTVRTDIVAQQFEEVNADITALDSEAVKKTLGKNKFDPATSVSGFISAYNGQISASETYKTTDFIDISEFENSVCVSPRLRDALQYDENKGYIQSTYISTTTNNAVITINENAKYIRVSYWGSEENILQVEDNTEVSSYVPYGIFVEDPVNCLNDETKQAIEEYFGAKAYNPLFGKKWVPCGDSFTYYTDKTYESGRFNGQPVTYPRIIAERNGMDIEGAFFASGRTLAYPSDGTFTNSLTCPTNAGYYQNIPEDADYITIMLGINDCQHTGSGTTGDGEDATGEITLGTINDNTTATYYGAWNVVLGWLRENRPFAHVGIIVTNGTERQDYTEAQIAIANKWGYPFINLNGDNITPAMLRCYNTDIPNALKTTLKQKQAVDNDGSITGSVNLHPNWQAHEYESVFIENWLKTL